MKLISFQEYCLIQTLVDEANITPEQSTRLISEGFLSNFAANIAKKYMLPVGMVMAIISGTGCNGTQCPTPQVTQQIKQELAKEVQNQQAQTNNQEVQNQQAQTNNQDVVINGNNFTATGRAKVSKLNSSISQEMAIMQAKSKVTKALGGKANLYRTTVTNRSIDNGILTVTIQGFLSQPNDGMNLEAPSQAQTQPGQVQPNGDSLSPRRLP